MGVAKPLWCPALQGPPLLQAEMRPAGVLGALGTHAVQTVLVAVTRASPRAAGVSLTPLPGSVLGLAGS